MTEIRPFRVEISDDPAKLTELGGPTEEVQRYLAREDALV